MVSQAGVWVGCSSAGAVPGNLGNDVSGLLSQGSVVAQWDLERTSWLNDFFYEIG